MTSRVGSEPPWRPTTTSSPTPTTAGGRTVSATARTSQNWPEWFTGPESSTYLSALYALSDQNSSYSQTLADPGGANQIVMFKSCFPNSSLAGNPDDPATPGYDLTVGSAKWVYNQLLTYFAAHPEKLFVVVTAPPNSESQYAANARAFNAWLLNDWRAQNHTSWPMWRFSTSTTC